MRSAVVHGNGQPGHVHPCSPGVDGHVHLRSTDLHDKLQPGHVHATKV